MEGVLYCIFDTPEFILSNVSKITLVYVLSFIDCVLLFLSAKTFPGDDGPIAPVGPVLPVAPVFVAKPGSPVQPVEPVLPVGPVLPVAPVAPLKVPSTLTLPCSVIVPPVCPILRTPSIESIKNVPVPERCIKLVS